MPCSALIGALLRSIWLKRELTWLVSARDRLIEELNIKSKRLQLKLEREKLKRKKVLYRVVLKSTEKDVAAYEAEVERNKKAIEDSDRVAKSAGVIVYKRSSWRRQKPRVGGMVWQGTDLRYYSQQFLFERK